MTVVLELSEEALERLRADAAARGVGEADLLRALVEERYAAAPPPELTRPGKLEWAEFARRVSEGVEGPPLSDAAISRAGIYGEQATLSGKAEC